MNWVNVWKKVWHARVSAECKYKQSLAPLPPRISDGQQKVINSMVFDEVAIICKTDIVKFGEKLMMCKEPMNTGCFSYKMLELGCLLLELREREPEAQQRDPREGSPS